MPSSFHLDFVGIAAPKSGSTWIADCLREHPQIFISADKELTYFSAHFVEDQSIENYPFHQSIEWYAHFFREAKSGQKTGEFTPAYFRDRIAPERMHELFPDTKLIAVLRHPVRRAFSHYLYDRQLGLDSGGSFSQALQTRSYLVDYSLYGEKLASFFARFPRERIYVIVFEKFIRTPEKSLHALEKFLWAESSLLGTLYRKSNERWDPIAPLLHQSLQKIRRFLSRRKMYRTLQWARKTGIFRFMYELVCMTLKTRPKTPHTLDPDLYSRLYREFFQSDVRALSKLIGIDFEMIWQS